MPASSRASEVPTLGLSVPDGAPSASRRLTPTPAPSSPSDGRKSRTSETSPVLLTMREGKPDGGKGPLLAIDESLTLAQGNGQGGFCGRAGFPAKPAALPGSGQASPESAASSPSPSSTLWSVTDLPPSSSRTYRASSPVIEGGTWRRSSVAWGTSGTGGRFGFSTLATSECPSADDGSSSSVCAAVPTTLTDVLQPSAPPRFSLSARAARGILRRATKRGRMLPPELEAALTSLARSTPPSDITGPDGPISPLPQGTSSVRRLTPVECERLMGWPDGWTVVENWSARSGSARSGTKTVAPAIPSPLSSSRSTRSAVDPTTTKRKRAISPSEVAP